MHLAYPRAEMERRILERIEVGWTLAQLEADGGFPSRQTVYRWAAEDAGFAQRLKDARAWRRRERVQARAAPSFNEPVAEAFLARVRAGEAVRALVKAPGMPPRDQLTRWKRERPDFAARLAQAVAFARAGRPKRWVRYDEAAADIIILRVSKGESVPSVLADPALPGATAVRRWKCAQPDFAAALESAKRVGHRVKMGRRSKLTPALRDRICLRIVDGLSLHAVGRLPGMPHHVTLYGWMRRDPEFARHVRISERFRNELMLDSTLDITMGLRSEAEVPAARRRIGAVMKQLGRMAPKRRDEA